MWRIDHVSGALAPGWSTWRIAMLLVSMAIATGGSWLFSVVHPSLGCATAGAPSSDDVYEVHEVELIEAGVPDQNPAR